MGIVISRGAHEERPPLFLAYVWGPAPELEAELEAKLEGGELDTPELEIAGAELAGELEHFDLHRPPATDR
jgi:hypothetical protein